MSSGSISCVAVPFPRICREATSHNYHGDRDTLFSSGYEPHRVVSRHQGVGAGHWVSHEARRKMVSGQTLLAMQKQRCSCCLARRAMSHKGSCELCATAWQMILVSRYMWQSVVTHGRSQRKWFRLWTPEERRQKLAARAEEKNRKLAARRAGYKPQHCHGSSNNEARWQSGRSHIANSPTYGWSHSALLGAPPPGAPPDWGTFGAPPPGLGGWSASAADEPTKLDAMD